jgi:nucleoside-diphosphate-sugar epimerase
MIRFLITGATGFVGTALREDLERRGHVPILAARGSVDGRGEYRVVGDIHGATDWSRAVEGVDVVFHLAGYAHQFGRAGSNERAFFRINVDGTRRLAEQAASAGVRRLIFVSSIKANGDESPASGFDETTDPAPEDAYGRSKLAAEIALHEAARATGLSVTVIRPPLIYGPRVKANFYRLLSVIDRGMPLPFGSIRNRRSLIYVSNLTDALVHVATDARAEGKTYLVSDGEDVSTPDLVRRIALALGRSPRLAPVPVSLLKLAGSLTGKGSAVRRLVGSLVADSRLIRTELGWAPPHSMTAGLQETALWYRTARSNQS